MQKKRAVSIGIRAALVALLGTAVAVALSCSSTPAAPPESMGSTQSGLTSCGAPIVHHTTAGTSVSPGTTFPYAPPTSFMIPPTVQATGGMWYPNVSITATLALTPSVVCTYRSTVPQVPLVDLVFQSCTGGKGIGDFVPTSSVTLSGLVGGAAGTAGLDATLSVTTDDGNPCSYDSCANGAVSHTDAPEGTSCDDDNDVCNGTKVCQAGVCGGADAGLVLPAVDDGDPCTSDSCSPSTGVTHTYICTPPTDAGVSDPTASQDFSKNVEVFYTGSSPQQVGVDAGTIDAKRATVIRGAVYRPTLSDAGLDAGPDRVALSAVTVSILNHPEFGSTATRDDGRFELVVNGGDPLTVQYALAGYLGSQRRAETRWHDWTIVDDVVLIQEAPLAATAVPPNDSVWHYVKGPTIDDGEGARTPTLIIPAYTTVNNWTPPSGQLQFRMTEYTVGSTGPAAMPGSLPPQSAYTYAVEMKVEGAPTPTSFNQPVILYVDNFNGTLMDTTPNGPGMEVPNGYYDTATGVWKAEESGRIVKILSITNGKADLSLDGTNLAISQYGISDLEREQVALAYASYPNGGAGKTFWRVHLAHFSTEDLNWGAPPINAEFPPKNLKAESSAARPDPCVKHASIIECENGVLGETLGLTGTPFDLHYRSETQDGFKTQIKVPYSGPAYPQNLQDFVRAEVEVDIQGRRYYFGISARDFRQNAFVTVDWDRRDGANRPVQGTAIADIRVAWVYRAASGRTSQFGGSPGQQIVGNRAERVIKMERYFHLLVGAFDARGQGLGGWTVGLQHVLDAEHGIVWHGDGTKQVLSAAGKVLRTDATLSGGSSSGTLAVSSDGAIYRESNGNIYRTFGGVTTAIGSSAYGDNGYTIPDGSPLSGLQMANGGGPIAISASHDGGLLVAIAGARIFRVGPGSTYPVKLIYGAHANVASNYGLDGDLALGATTPMNNGFSGVAEGPDGSVYFIGYNKGWVRRILPNGRLETVAGTVGSAGSPGVQCWAPAPTGCIAKNELLGSLYGLAVSPDGSVYLGMAQAIWRVTSDGRLSLAAGVADGVSQPAALACGDGQLFYVESQHTVRAIEPEGRVVTLAGNGAPAGPVADGAGALSSPITPWDGLAFGPDGSLHFIDRDWTRRIETSMRRLANGDYLVPSPDGSEVYRFDSHGRHWETLTGARGKSRWVFGYDTQSGRLLTVHDALGGSHADTTLAYTSSGATITSPFGKVNTLTIANNLLTSVAEPETSYTVAHSASGLLTSFQQASGALHTFTFTPSGRLASDKDGTPLSPGITLQRTDALTSFTSELTTGEGRKTTHVVDVGNDPNNPSVVELRRHIDPNGLETKDARNFDGSRKTTLPDGTTTTTAYSPDPRYGGAAPFVSSSTVTSGGKSVTVTQTSTVDELTDPSNPTTLSKATTTTTIGGKTKTTKFTANPDGTATVESTSPVGRKSRTYLDDRDRVTRIEPRGVLPALNLAQVTPSPTVTPSPIDITYDTDGNVQTVTQGGRTTTYSYEALTGFLSSVIAPLGTTSYNYAREDGLPQDTFLPGGRIVEASWNAAGSLTSVLVPRASGTWFQHDFDHDNLERSTAYKPPNLGFTPKDTGYTYDKDSALVSLNQPTGSAVIERDFGGRQTKVTFPDPVGLGTRTVETTYDKQRVFTVTSKLNGAADATLTYGYDGLMLKSEAYSGPFTRTVNRTFDALMRPDTRQLDTSTETKATFSYDDDSLLASVKLDGAAPITYVTTRETVDNAVLKSTATNGPNGVTDSYEYDAYGAVVHYQVKTGGSNIVYDVVYDRSPFPNQPSTGRIKSKTEIINGLYNTACVTSYTYNAQNFLATSTRTGACSGGATYTYDLAGNRGGLNYDAQDRLATDVYGWEHQYTNDGAMSGLASGGYPYYHYLYDLFGNMRRSWHYWGGDVRYVIDGLGRRIARTNANGSLINGYLYDGSRIIGETDAGGNVIAHYVYANRGNVPDFMVRKVSNSWHTYRLISDLTGSPKLLIDLAGNAIVERYDWDDWGVAIGGGAWPGAKHPFGFAGGLWDGDVGLYRFGARDYRPFDGRWWSKDPSGFAGGVNLYLYAAGDPVNLIDPTGHMPMDGSGAQERWSTYAAGDPEGAAPFGVAIILAAIPMFGEVVDAFIFEAMMATAGGGVETAVGAGAAGALASKASQNLSGNGGMCTVSRWGRPGIQPGDWVMLGRASWFNYILSGKWDPNPTNRIASFASGEEYQLPRDSLVMGREGLGIVIDLIKFALGQRRYQPPE